MTIIHQWTQKLAVAVAPDEVYLATSFADSYVTYLQVHQDNEKDNDSELAETEPSDQNEPCSVHFLLPVLLQNIGHLSHELKVLIQPESVAMTASVLEISIRLNEYLQERKSDKEKEALLRAAMNKEETGLKLAGNHSVYTSVIDGLTEGLKDYGVADKAAELIAFKTCHQFVEDREGAVNLLDALDQ